MSPPTGTKVRIIHNTSNPHYLRIGIEGVLGYKYPKFLGMEQLYDFKVGEYNYHIGISDFEIIK